MDSYTTCSATLSALRSAVVGDYAGLSPSELAAMTWSGGELRRYLMNGGRLRRTLPPSREQRDSRLPLSSCLVDGRPIRNVHDVQAVLAWLRAQAIASTHATRWGQAGPDGAPERARDLVERITSDGYPHLRRGLSTRQSLMRPSTR
jgi:hypothetical protein